MVHLADTEKPQKIFELSENQTFVQFIDQTQKLHSACIKVLIYDENRGERLIIQAYRYMKPNEKKDFTDEVHWDTDSEQIEISINNKLRKILFPSED